MTAPSKHYKGTSDRFLPSNRIVDMSSQAPSRARNIAHPPPAAQDVNSSSVESGYVSSSSGASSALGHPPPAPTYPANPAQAGHGLAATTQQGGHGGYGAGGLLPPHGFQTQQQHPPHQQQQQYRAPQPRARGPPPAAPVTFALQGGGQLAHTAAGWLPAQHLGGGGGYAAYQGGGFGVAVAAAPAQGAAYAGRRAKPAVPFQPSSTNVGMYASGESGSDGSDWGSRQKQLKKADLVRCSTCGAEMDKSWMSRHMADVHGLVYRE